MKRKSFISGAMITLSLIAGLFACGQNQVTNTGANSNQDNHTSSLSKNESKMKIEIWSDVVCPFCYIGKTKFEAALNEFAEKHEVEIEWKSYQLMPDLVTQPDKTADQVLADSKGWSLKQAKELNDQAAMMGKQAGLDYRFDKAIVANTFQAHQFLHFAKASGKQQEAESLMFKSYFTDGRNIDDLSTLIELGKTIGLDPENLRKALESKTYSNDVKADISEAQQIGVRGVPFFVFDRKYAISGAQSPEVFLETIEKSFAEWRKTHPKATLNITEGATCKPGKPCN